MKRKSYCTPVDPEIQEKFKQACKSAGLKQNEALEQLMINFAEGKIIINKKLSYEIKQKN